MRSFFKIIINVLINIFPRYMQVRFARYILNRAQGEGNDDPAVNGEYFLLDKIKKNHFTGGNILFDVGANIGEYTKRAVLNTNNKLIIYCFEPVYNTFIVLNKFILKANIIPVNASLSDKDNVANIYISGYLSGTNSMHQRHPGALGEIRQDTVEEIKTIRGDSFCNENGIEHIHFLKIDTEGHELAVLKGFERMLSEGKIDFIQFEYGGCWIDARILLKDAFEYLLPKRYIIGKIHPKGVEIFKQYDFRQETFMYANYFAISSELFEIVKCNKWFNFY